MDLNRATIIGRLTRDPEQKATQSGQAISTFSVATNHTWTDTNGQKQQDVEYHNIVAWRKRADICNQYLRKGSKVYIEGRIKTRTWQDPNGVNKNRTEIILDNMIMLDSKGATPTYKPVDNQVTNEPIVQVQPENNQDDEISLEDIPF